jgi:hypothetical protein
MVRLSHNSQAYALRLPYDRRLAMNSIILLLAQSSQIKGDADEAFV